MESVTLNGIKISVGDKVKFINDVGLYTNTDINKPVLGVVYTISGFTIFGGLYLKEIENKRYRFENENNLLAIPGFRVDRFETTYDVKIDMEILPEVIERIEIPVRLDMNSILDKISKYGIDSLVKEEKDFLDSL